MIFVFVENENMGYFPSIDSYVIPLSWHLMTKYDDTLNKLPTSSTDVLDSAKLVARCLDSWSHVVTIPATGFQISALHSSGIALTLANNSDPDILLAHLNEDHVSDLQSYLRNIVKTFAGYLRSRTWLFILTTINQCPATCVENIFRTFGELYVARTVVVTDKVVWSYDPYRLWAGLAFLRKNNGTDECSLRDFMPLYLHGKPLRVAMFRNPPWGNEVEDVPILTTSSPQPTSNESKLSTSDKNIAMDERDAYADGSLNKGEETHGGHDKEGRNHGNRKNYHMVSTLVRNPDDTSNENFTTPSTTGVNKESSNNNHAQGAVDGPEGSWDHCATITSPRTSPPPPGGFRGPDWLLVAEAARWLRGHVYLVPGDGRTFGGFVGGCLVGTSGDVAYGRADVAANRKFPKLPHAPFLAFSDFINSEALVCVVPKAERVPLYLSVFLAFPPPLWALTAAALLAMSVAWNAVAWGQAGTGVGAEAAGRRALAAAGALLGQPPPARAPTAAGNRVHWCWRERALVALWAACCSVTCGAFQGALTSRAAAPAYRSDLDTTEALARSPLRIVTHHAVRPLLRYTPPTLLSKVVYMYDAEEMDRLATQTREWCVLTTRSNALMMVQDPRYADADGQPRLHTVAEPLTHGYVLFEAARGWPLLHRFNTALSRLREAGIIAHWEDDVRTRERLLAARRVAEDTYPSGGGGRVGGGPKPLRVSHTQGAFALLALGLCAATVAAGIERSRWCC